MTMTTFNIIEISGASGLALVCLLVFLRHRKTSDLFQRYCEAMQAENNGEEEKAIHLYQDALSRSRKTIAGDKKLKGNIEQRLKTLMLSTSFERSFKRAKEAIM
jgi:hypothetical protein